MKFSSFIEKPRQEILKCSPVETVLESREIECRSPLQGGSNKSEFIKLKDNGSGVFKPMDGEIIVSKEGTGYKRERAAYLADLFLGFNLVPPTVIREVDGRIGSVQEYVPQSQAGYELGDLEEIEPHIQSQKNILDIFDAIIGNFDRHGGNWLVDKNKKLWAIVHGYAFFTDYFNFNIIQDMVESEFDADVVLKIKALAESETKKNLLRILLLELLDKEEAEDCIERLELVADSFEGNKISEKADKLSTQWWDYTHNHL